MFAEVLYWSALGTGSSTLCGFLPPFSFSFFFIVRLLVLLRGLRS